MICGIVARANEEGALYNLTPEDARAYYNQAPNAVVGPVLNPNLILAPTYIPVQPPTAINPTLTVNVSLSPRDLARPTDILPNVQKVNPAESGTVPTLSSGRPSALQNPFDTRSTSEKATQDALDFLWDWLPSGGGDNPWHIPNRFWALVVTAAGLYLWSKRGK